ncbi:MAG: polysaccharide biosynthesis tyrosine autokinase [Candidatus Eisenbacteria bacterium]
MPVEENEVTFHDYLRIVFERKWIILPLLIITIALTGYYTFTQPEVYQATATLMIGPGGTGQSILGFGYQSRGSSPIQNYCQILKSRSVAKKTADRLNDMPVVSTSPVTTYNADAMMGRIGVEPVRGTDVLKVSGRASTPEAAAIIANTVTDVFIEEQITIVRGEYTQQRLFLEEQIPIAEAKLQISEEDLKLFKEENEFVALSEETRGTTQKLVEFDKQLGETQTGINTTLTRLDYLEAQLAEQQKTLPEDIAEVSSPYILELRRQLVELETNASMYLVQGLAEDSPKMANLRKSIEDTKSNLIEETKSLGGKDIPSLDPLSYARNLFDRVLELKGEMVTLNARRDALLGVRKIYAVKLEKLPKTELDLARLERDRLLNNSTYGMLMQKYEEAKIAEAGKISNIRVVDRARVPRSPIQPQKKRNMAFGAIIGLALGLGAAFMLDYTDNSVRTPKDIDRSGSMTILGTVPMIKVKASKKDRASGIVAHLLTEQPTRSSLGEAFRSIRTNLQFASPDKPIHTLLVTSAIPGEGKSTVTSNLGIAMAQMGIRTLLVDTDLRKPVLRKVFKLEQETGFTDFMADHISLEEALCQTDVENLTVLPAGSLPPNPSELIGSKKMESVIERLKNDYQLVIFDSPPAIGVTDAAILGSKLDGAVLVVRTGKTDRAALLRAKEILERVHTNVLGVVLHMVTPVHGRYGYYYGYYYHYYPYYGEGNDKKSKRSKKKDKDREKEPETVSC